MAQRSKEWFLHRWDKFTGSEIPDLMKQGRGKDEQWGATAKKVILRKISYERMTDEGREMQAEIEMRKDFVQTRWGNTYEPEARAKYAEQTGYLVNEVGFMVNPEMPFNGGSFDGEVINTPPELLGLKSRFGDMYKVINGLHRIGIIEIKCPYDPDKHESNASLSIAGIEIKHEYYAQIQNNINVAGVDWCDFISYDPRKKQEYQLVIIRVARDDIFIAGMVERIKKAQQIKEMVLNGVAIDDACKKVA
jgi:putative phage-type endonuclease